jgi:hypothetical protein
MKTQNVCVCGGEGVLLLLCVNITADVYVYITPSSSFNSTAESLREGF